MPLLGKRVLLKLSGEALGGRGQGLDHRRVLQVVAEIKLIRRLGVQLAVVIGGGNFWRKRDSAVTLKPVTSDYLGMLGTVLNSLALKDYLKRAGIPVELQSFLVNAPGLSSLDIPRARRALTQGQVVVFAGGTGKPRVTTDTAAAQRAHDIGAEFIIKAGPVDGVYSADPRQVRRARRFTTISLAEALKRHLGVIDRQALRLCLRWKIPIVVCRFKPKVLKRLLDGKKVGTEMTV